MQPDQIGRRTPVDLGVVGDVRKASKSLLERRHQTIRLRDRHWNPASVVSFRLTGSEDGTHPSSFALKARIPGCEMKILYGAGHACQIEQPWLFNRYMIEFLAKHGLFPGRRN